MDHQLLSGTQKRTVQYFQAADVSFWKWVDKGEVIEWQSGKTICYREDLAEILRQLDSFYLLPLDTILLVLAACQGDRKDFSKHLDDLFQVQRHLQSLSGEPSDHSIEHTLTKALEFLGTVADLPKELKKGTSRIYLIQQISKQRSRLTYEGSTSDILATFAGGQVDEFILGRSKALTRTDFHNILTPLNMGRNAFKEANSLENMLRTGLKDIPATAEIELPEIQGKDLLDELAEDPQTYGLAQLTRRMIAAVQIPMHTRGSSDQAFGGVSDISNRGELDRLLLSELAYDDDTLMARLVNNETLYYQHEEPPTNPIERRIILIDTTIKMWGVPRAMAVSAALALSHSTKESTHIQAFAVGGTDVIELDLKEKTGILEALGQLDPALDCGDALLEFVRTRPRDPKTEMVLITGEHFLTQDRLIPLLPEIKSSIQFLIEIGREGRISTFQLTYGNRKKLNESLLHLEDSLFAEAPRKQQETVRRSTIKHANSKIPLYLPAAYVQLKPGFVFDLKLDGVMAITSTHRWLYWPSKNEGAREILNGVPTGAYFWGKENAQLDFDTPYLYESVFLLIYQRNQNRLLMYEYDTSQGRQSQISELSLQEETVNGLVYQNRNFFIRTQYSFYRLGKEVTNHAVQGKKKRAIVPLFEEENIFHLPNSRPRQKPNFALIKPFINNGYSTFLKIPSIGISQNGNLVVDKKELKLQGPNTIIWQPLLRAYPVLPANYETKRWKDGSRVWVDNRGFLHLQSSDTRIPRISIVTVIGKPTACYSADGHFCGSPYFLGKQKEGLMDCKEFHLTYLKPFLQVIETHNAT